MRMKKSLLILIVFAILALSTQAQITFHKTYNSCNFCYGEAYAVQQTSDGGYIMTGYIESYIYLVKTDANGDTLWTRTYGNAVDYHKGYSVQQTNDGGYVIAGITENSTSVPVHIYLIKTNSNGDTLWTKSYGSAGNDYGYSVRQTMDNGFIIAGTTDSLGAGGVDVFLIKTNSIGDTLWTKTYGGINDDGAKSIELTTDGGYIIAGYTKSFGAGSDDVYLIKTDSIGDTLWTKTYGSIYYDYGYSVKQTSDGGYIITGMSNFGNRIYLIKTNSIGDTLWTKAYGKYGSGTDYAYSVQQTSDGGYIMVGITVNPIDPYYEPLLIKTNSIGETLWAKHYLDGAPGYNIGYYVQQSTDGGYIIAGETAGNMLLIKTDENGNSGCLQTDPTINLYSIPFQVSNTSTIIHSGCMVSNPSKTVGSGGIVTTSCFSTGINEIKATEDISIYPNPATNLLTISLPDKNIKSCTINLYDMLGEKMLGELRVENGALRIDVSTLLQGIYFLEVVMDNEKVVRKVVKI